MDLSEDDARAHIETMRWPNGPACVHCGSTNVYRMEGKSTRPGLLACRDCRGHFSVTVGTFMEDSRMPLATWLRAFRLLASSECPVSARQLQRDLRLGSYQTAWLLVRRIREASARDPLAMLLREEFAHG
jgi:transposase-like protein